MDAGEPQPPRAPKRRGHDTRPNTSGSSSSRANLRKDLAVTPCHYRYPFIRFSAHPFVGLGRRRLLPYIRVQIIGILSCLILGDEVRHNLLRLVKLAEVVREGSRPLVPIQKGVAFPHALV